MNMKLQTDVDTPSATKLGLHPKYEPGIMLDDTRINTVPDPNRSRQDIW